MSVRMVAVLGASTGIGASHAAGAAEHLGLMSELQFLGVGLAIVLGTLTLLCLLTALVGKLFVWSERANSLRRELPSSTLQPTSGPTVQEPAVPIAAIVAAVAVVLDARHRIIAVEPQQQGWAVEGRRRIFASHQLR